MSKTYMKKEGGDGKIICCSLSNWGRYRADGFVFVETDEDGNTPEQQYKAQVNAAPAEVEAEAKPASKKKAAKKK